MVGQPVGRKKRFHGSIHVPAPWELITELQPWRYNKNATIAHFREYGTQESQQNFFKYPEKKYNCPKGEQKKINISENLINLYNNTSPKI